MEDEETYAIVLCDVATIDDLRHVRLCFSQCPRFAGFVAVVKRGEDATPYEDTRSRGACFFFTFRSMPAPTPPLHSQQRLPVAVQFYSTPSGGLLERKHFEEVKLLYLQVELAEKETATAREQAETARRLEEDKHRREVERLRKFIIDKGLDPPPPAQNT